MGRFTGESVPAPSFSEELRDDENHDGAEDAATKNKIEQRIAGGCQRGKDNKKRAHGRIG